MSRDREENVVSCEEFDRKKIKYLQNRGLRNNDV